MIQFWFYGFWLPNQLTINIILLASLHGYLLFRIIHELELPIESQTEKSGILHVASSQSSLRPMAPLLKP